MATVDPRQVYAAEKARAAERKRAAFAAADAAFTAWYQDVGARAEQHSKGHAGAHYGQVVATAPRCHCGKATRAFGLCLNHYSQWVRASHGQRLVARNQVAVCHPDRPHHGRGLCRECFDGTPEERRRRRIRRMRDRYLRAEHHQVRWQPGGVPAWNCPHTTKRARARGLCAACYKRHCEHGTLAQFAIVRAPTARYCARHPTRRVRARGWCQQCYLRWWKSQHLSKTGRRKERLRLPGMPLACGHDRPHAARDLCRLCYAKWYNAERRRRPRSRQRMPRGAKLVLCGHPERPFYARGCCNRCWQRKVFDQPEFRRRFATLFEQAVVEQRRQHLARVAS